MLRKLLFVCAALLAVCAVSYTDAACKVKGSDAVANEAESTRNATNNKIQAAPKKRLTNKLAFDVVAKKTSSDDDDSEDNED
ncbi:hypothetical protein FI667_g1478, partial [Globisporangium splendens]